jgi:hypothetical protein
MSSRRFPRFLITALFSLLCALPALADSHVRIVRLSVVEGSVKVDRGSGQFEKAITNLPITEGMKLRTADDGRAEIEFEDGSTVRIAPDSTVAFTQLSLRDSGTKVSTVDVIKGTAYVEFTGNKDDELTTQFGQEKVLFTHAAHARIGVDQDGASFAVFKGDLEVNGPSGAVEVKKNQTANFDFSANGTFKLAKKVQQQPEDDWDTEQNQYHRQYASNSYNSYSPYQYGTADLAYYGNFFNYPGYGMLWQPYFAGAGWDPFMDGAWAFYPGSGFGWVSAYPWGWTPYHYGTWVFLPGYGWAWQPGGAWMPMYTQVAVLNPPAGFVAPKAPAGGTGTVAVGRKPGLTTAAGSKMVIRNNSAGLGLPRGEFNNMAKLSQKVEKNGMVTQRVPAPISSPGFGSVSARGGMARGEARGSARQSEPHPMSFPSAAAPSGHSSAPAPHK